MYIYDTCLMIVLTLIIVLPLLLNKNIFRQIYIDIRKCKNDNMSEFKKSIHPDKICEYISEIINNKS